MILLQNDAICYTYKQKTTGYMHTQWFKLQIIAHYKVYGTKVPFSLTINSLSLDSTSFFVGRIRTA